MKTFASCVLVLLGLLLRMHAAELVTITVTVTNNPVGNTNKFTLNSSVRTVTNTITASPSTLIQQTNTTAWFATNLINHLGLYPVSYGHLLSQTSETNVVIRGRVGETMTATIAGAWGFVTYATNTASSPTFIVRMPITTEASSNRTHIASLLAQAISDYATNAIATNAIATSNFITKGASALQKITSPLQLSGTLGVSVGSFTNVSLYNATNRGYLGAVTNGYWTNGVLDSPKATNLVSYGSISAPGSGTSSEQFGAGARAGSDYDSAFGATSLATNGSAAAFGNGAAAFAGGAAIGSLSTANTNSAAVGYGTRAAGVGNVVIGPNNDDDGFANIIILGNGITATDDNQVIIGGAEQVVSFQSPIVGAVATNWTIRGTNHLNGDLSFGRFSNTSMINGNNSGILIGTNVIVELSGATTIAQYAGFIASRDGDQRVIRMSGAVTNIIVDANDPIYSPDGTAANRIKTGTGGALILTNAPSWLRMTYRAATSLWEVESHSR